MSGNEDADDVAKRTRAGAERAAAGAAIAGAQRVVAAGHLPLDGDGLGSALGLVHALRAAGREAVVLLGEEPPRNLRFLPGLDTAVRHPDPLPFQPDLFVALDGGGADRFRDMLPTDGTPVLNLDHHVTNERFGTLDWVDPGSAATGLMVYELLCDLGLPIDLAAAECLYTTLVTDTGRSASCASPARSSRGSRRARTGGWHGPRLRSTCAARAASHRPTRMT
jgi:nanoRNase/pAp phosphatase (c-di-AMP/oligoRNAs hydrolase)